MGWAIRALRALVLLPLVAVGAVAVASPAGAATQQINGAVVAPIATHGPRGFTTDFDGVLVDGALGVYQFQLRNSVGCCPRITLIASDGSVLQLQTERQSFAEVVPNLLYSTHRELLVAGGTGRFTGASGAGTYDSTFTPSVPLSASPLGSVMVGSLDVQLTTP